MEQNNDKLFGIEPPAGAQVNFHVGYIKNAEGEIEYTRPLPSIRVPKVPPEAFPAATPARITPSRQRPAQRPYKTLFAFGDTQIGYRRILDHDTQQDELIPLHDERAMRVARLICRAIRPDIIVNLGDSIDLSSLSRFKPDSDHFQRELGPSFQRVHNYYAELRSDNPEARIVEVSSNHNQRLTDFVLKNMPQFYGVKRASSKKDDYPVMTYPYLANLAPLNVEWVGGYPAGEFVYGEEYGAPPIIFRHGTETSQNGTTASKIMKNRPETHNIQGHDHSMSEAWKTLRNGNILGNFVVGALCRTTGEVPGYHSAVNDRNRPVHRQEDWQQSIMIIKDYCNGNYGFKQVPIIHGVAYLDGKVFNGNL